MKLDFVQEKADIYSLAVTMVVYLNALSDEEIEGIE